jgi:hypothetical protein
MITSQFVHRGHRSGNRPAILHVGIALDINVRFCHFCIALDIRYFELTFCRMVEHNIVCIKIYFQIFKKFIFI